MVINAPCYGNEALTSPKQTALELAIPRQTTTGKESSNPFKAGSLPETIHFCDSRKFKNHSSDNEESLGEDASKQGRIDDNKISNSKVEDDKETALEVKKCLDTSSWCMMAIFHDMIEETMEVFMEDFSIISDSFSSCLSHLDKMLKRCEDTNLVLNWEKCHFMVKEGIVLGHKISKSEIEVDKAKVDVIAKLPHPTSVKGIRSFLGHAGFYHRFIQDFSKIARPMTHLIG
ncbi:hypothetical protein Tco_0730900, partial [Tanacetum coccineum]